MSQHQNRQIVEGTVSDLPPRCASRKKVVIIGAGASGLTAAYQLRGSGHEVIVLEARTRPGGRVHSVRHEFADDLHAEAGALFIPTGHEYLMKYVRLTGLADSLEPVPPEQLAGFYFLGGQRYLEDADGLQHWKFDDSVERAVWPGELNEDEVRATVDDLCEQLLEKIEGGVGNPESQDWPPERLHHLEDLPVLDWLRSLGVSDDGVELIRSTHLAAFGRDQGRSLSPLFVIQQWVDSRNLSSATGWHTIPGGNDRWLRRLAQMLAPTITYGAQVVALYDDDNGVAVTVERCGRSETIEADFVISAIPFGCLRDVEIRSGLSSDKEMVINDLQGTPVAHLFLQCSRRVWRRANGQGVFALSFTDTDLATIIRDATFNQAGPRAVLDLYMTGSQAERMDEMDEERRLFTALEGLEKIFTGISDVAEGATYHSWSADPFSRGDYVYFDHGEFTRLFPHVATPEGRIIFAGDQTSAKSAWQDGAIASGHRAALEVANAAENLQRPELAGASSSP